MARLDFKLLRHGCEATRGELRRQLGRGINGGAQLAFCNRAISEWRAQRVTEHDGLPAQIRHGEVKRLGERHAANVGGEQDVRTNRGIEIGLVDVPGRASDAISNQIADQRLGGSAQSTMRAVPIRQAPRSREAPVTFARPC